MSSGIVLLPLLSSVVVGIIHRREGECYVVNGRLDAYMLYPYKTVGTCNLFISLCLFRSSTLSSLDVLKSFMGDIKWVTRKVAILMPADQP